MKKPIPPMIFNILAVVVKVLSEFNISGIYAGNIIEIEDINIGNITNIIGIKL